jgi:hemolysin activation/secretion protein
MKPAVTIGIGYLSSRERDSKVPDNNNLVYSLKGPSYDAAAGLSYFIIPSASFDLGVQYTHNRLKDKLRIHEIEKQNIIAGTFGTTITS